MLKYEQKKKEQRKSTRIKRKGKIKLMKENVPTSKLKCQLMKLACSLQLNVERLQWNTHKTELKKEEQRKILIWNNSRSAKWKNRIIRSSHLVVPWRSTERIQHGKLLSFLFYQIQWNCKESREISFSLYLNEKIRVAFCKNLWE